MSHIPIFLGLKYSEAQVFHQQSIHTYIIIFFQKMDNFSTLFQSLLRQNFNRFCLSVCLYASLTNFQLYFTETDFSVYAQICTVCGINIINKLTGTRQELGHIYIMQHVAMPTSGNKKCSQSSDFHTTAGIGITPSPGGQHFLWAEMLCKQNICNFQV